MTSKIRLATTCWVLRSCHGELASSAMVGISLFFVLPQHLNAAKLITIL